MRSSKIKQLETVAGRLRLLFIAVTRCYRLAEELYFIAWVSMFCNKIKSVVLRTLFYLILFYRTCASALSSGDIALAVFIHHAIILNSAASKQVMKAVQGYIANRD